MHDHKLYESATVPAKAKLQFEGVNNHTYTCLRNWKSEHKRDNAEPSLSSVGSSLKDETDDVFRNYYYTSIEKYRYTMCRVR